jgi:hypothetical protein
MTTRTTHNLRDIRLAPHWDRTTRWASASGGVLVPGERRVERFPSGARQDGRSPELTGSAWVYYLK